MNPARFFSLSRHLSPAKRLEWYPPFWLMGVKVLELAPDWRTVRIRLPLTWVSRNAGGFMFGGFQASLADPIAAISCARVFKGWSVWTRALKLDFLREGRTDLELRFTFDPALEARIHQELETRGRSTPEFEFSYHLDDGAVCTRVHNTVAIRSRGYRPPDRRGNKRTTGNSP